MQAQHIVLDHTIVGQGLTSLTFDKNREYAGCRICGALFQPSALYNQPQEIRQWRDRHNNRHSEQTHRRFRVSGLTFTPEAAHKLAPFGLVPVEPLFSHPNHRREIAHALLTAPRLPADDVERR